MSLWNAVFTGNKNEIRNLLGQHVELEQKGSDPTRPYDRNDATCYSTPLQLAVWLGNVEIVELLLENSANIYIRSVSHGPLLITAILSIGVDGTPSKLAITRMLLERGADPTDLDSEGVSPLQVAARLG